MLDPDESIGGRVPVPTALAGEGKLGDGSLRVVSELLDGVDVCTTRSFVHVDRDDVWVVGE